MSARRERKVVTVLFADLVGFTSRAESLDPEDVEAILAPYHERLRSELERSAAPWRSSSAMRSWRCSARRSRTRTTPSAPCAPRSRSASGPRRRASSRCGSAVTTGEALVSLDARPETGEGMASGDVVNTASRLQAAAPVNGILVDETTYRATERAIDFERPSRSRRRGSASRCAVWEARRGGARVRRRRQRGAATPLVGRRAGARAARRRRSTRAKSERSTQLRHTGRRTRDRQEPAGRASCSGRLGADPELDHLAPGAVAAVRRGVAFWALGGDGQGPGRHPRDRRRPAGRTEAAEAGRTRVLGDGARPRWVEAKLRPLVGHRDAAEQGDDAAPRASPPGGASSRRWRSSGRRCWCSRISTGPTTDLLDFVDQLVDWADDVPLLVVCTARPELFDRRPGWGGGKPNALDDLALAARRRGDGATVTALLERAVLPAEQQTALLGAPAATRCTRSSSPACSPSAATRRASCRCPRRCRGSSPRASTRLAAEEKALLQDAAVVGKVFWAGALAAMDGRDRSGRRAALHALQRKEFVRRERRSSVEGESEYAFLHLLVRDVAYGQIPRAARLAKHARSPSGWPRSGDRRGPRRDACPSLSPGARLWPSRRRGRPRARGEREARASQRRRPRARPQRVRFCARFYGAPSISGRATTRNGHTCSSASGPQAIGPRRRPQSSRRRGRSS